MDNYVLNFLFNKYNISKEELFNQITKGNIIIFKDLPSCFKFLYNLEDKSKEYILEEYYKLLNLILKPESIDENIKLGDYLLKKYRNLEIIEGNYILLYNSFFYENNIFERK